MLAELRHGDASQRKSGGIVAQGDPVESAQRVAGGECAARGRD
jgi:hypothetical protein